MQIKLFFCSSAKPREKCMGKVSPFYFVSLAALASRFKRINFLLDTAFIWGRYLIEKIRYLFLLTIKRISSNPCLRLKFILGYALRSIPMCNSCGRERVCNNN